MVVKACHPSLWEVEARGPGVQVHPLKFKASLSYGDPASKKKKEKQANK